MVNEKQNTVATLREKALGKSLNIRKKDPIRLLNEARALVTQASEIIKKQVEETDAEAEEHRQAIAALDQTKKEILAQKEAIFNEIVACA